VYRLCDLCIRIHIDLYIRIDQDHTTAPLLFVCKYLSRERIVTEEEIRNYIQREITNLAAIKYPKDERLQLIYQLGFVVAQLASSVYRDSHVGSRFKDRVDAARKRGRGPAA
jgi:hypothetical protein